ncbi:hypothetical protein ACFL0V_07465, partial [Nanoarchaeota archaeon]
MQSKNWTKLVTRRLAVQVAIAWNHGFGTLFDQRYRTGIPNTLVFYDGKKTDYFVVEEELNKYNEDLDKLLENPEFVAGMMPEAKEFVEETYIHIKNLIRDAENKSNKGLANLFPKFAHHHANYYTRMWMVFRICERIILKIESLLTVKTDDKSKVKELSRIFSVPLIPNDVTNERMDLLRIALEQKKLGSEELRKALQEHTKKYQHIPMFDFDHEPYTYAHFANELEIIKNPE